MAGTKRANGRSIPNGNQLSVITGASITAGSIPRGSLGCDSDVGWVESFDGAQDRLHDTYHPLSSMPLALQAVSFHPELLFRGKEIQADHGKDDVGEPAGDPRRQGCAMA